MSALLIAGLIAGAETLLIVLAGDVVLLWAVATIRHAAARPTPIGGLARAH